MLKSFLVSIFIVFLFVLCSVLVHAQQDVPELKFSYVTKQSSSESMPTPSEYWPVFSAQTAYLDSIVTGDVAIFYGDGNTTIVNPVIIVDGFDPGDLRPIEGLWDLANQQNMIDSLRTYGNDFILLNFHAGADYIQRNAMLVVNMLDTVQYIMQQSGTYKENPQIVVVGPSMGGLITRYAITYMESNDLHHHVRNWISFDSPHKGANIPVGIQNWLRFFAEEADSDGAVFGLSKMNSVAAKQMLLYHYSATVDSIAGPNPLRNDLVSDLDALGFPQQSRIVAVANGSGFAVTQEFEAGEKVVDYFYTDLLVDLRGDIWAVPNQVAAKVFDGWYNTIAPLDEVLEQVYVKNTLSWDNALGGDSPTFWEIAEEDPGYGDIISLHDSHCFIPTISALCITNTNEPHFNVSQNVETILTPFDTIYYPYENQEHAEISAESYWWFKNEIHNFAPYFTCVPVILAYTDEYYEMDISASDVNYWNNLEFSITELPDWLSFDEQNLILSGTPQISNVGFNPVEIRVSDGLLETALEFDIEVVNNTKNYQACLDKIQVFPNPFSDKLFIKSNNRDDIKIGVYNLEGQLLFNGIINDFDSQIDLSFLSTGVYLFKITLLDEVRVLKISKQ